MRPSAPAYSLRIFLRNALWLVPSWIIAIFVCGRLAFGNEAHPNLTQESVLVVFLGIAWFATYRRLFAGLLGAAFEIWAMPLFMRRVSFVNTLLVRTIAYALLVATMLLVGILGVNARPQVQALGEGAAPPASFLEIVMGPESIFVFLLLLAASFLITLSFQVNRVLGPGTLRALLLGRYLRPVSEERIFLFLDLSDSTPIAERLGPLLFSQFKNDFFHDVARPVVATQGEIFQYVGDEVVVTWLVGQGVRHANCLRLFSIEREEIRPPGGR